MIKKLYTIGDSWTYGDELVNPKEDSWPSVLSKELGCELVNDAECGGSNDWMFRKTIEWVCSQDILDDVSVIVGWSEPNRREENYEFYNGSRLLDDNKTEKLIFGELHNGELAHYKSICYMVTLQEFLKSKNIKYLFFNVWYDLMGCEDGLLDRRERNKGFKWLKQKKLDSYAQDGNGFHPGCYSEDLNIGNIIQQIDKKHCIGPFISGYEKEYSVDDIVPNHPNKDEHRTMTKFIKEKLMELYI